VTTPTLPSVSLYAGTKVFGVYARQSAGPWPPLSHGLSGGAFTVLAMTLGSHPTLLAGTARGLFRYAPSG
jgi:hypothetical protein